MADDWLPADWNVDVRVRKSGKKDKFYVQSSTGVKLFSKPEVLRYLNKVNNICELQGTEKIGIEGSNKAKVNGSVTDSFFISTTDQSEAGKHGLEELPPGWIKRTKVTNSGGRNRKDSYYTDPVDGYIFRSKRQAFRYLKTRELGRHVIKPKDKGRSNKEFGGQFLADGALNEQIPLRNDNSKILENDQTIKSYSKDGRVSFVEHIKNPAGHEVDAAIKSFNQEEKANVWKQITPYAKDAENVLKTKQGVIWSSMDLPRHASKQLAGIEIDSLENKTGGVQRVSIGQVKVKECSTVDNPLDLDRPIAKKNESELEVKMDDPMSYLMMDPCIEFAVKILRDEIPLDDPSLDKFFAPPWRKDPCTEFAVKTLTGAIPLDNGGGGSKQQ